MKLNLDKKINFNILILFILLVSIFTFGYTYVAKTKYPDIYLKSILTKDLIIGIMFILFGIFFKNSKYMVSLAAIFPFAGYCDPFSDSIHSFYYVIAGLVLGIILNLIIYRPKIRINKYFTSFCALYLCLSVGGLFSSDPDYILESQKKLAFLFRIGVLFIPFFILLLSNICSFKFDEIAKSMTIVNVLIIIEILVKVFAHEKDNVDFLHTIMYLIWGFKNSICLPIMMTLPFVIYLMLNSGKLLYLYLMIVLANCFCVFIMFSRTTSIFFIPEILLLLIGHFIYSKGIKVNSKKLMNWFLVLFIVCIIGVLFVVIFKDYIKRMFSSEFMNLDTLRARFTIYKRAYEIIKNNLYFGIGYIGSFNFHVDTMGYQAVHQTIIQVMLISGTAGLLFFIWHVYEKYAKLLYKMDYPKFVIFVSYLGGAAIGLVDITYFQSIFLILLSALMVMTDSLIKEDKAIYLF